MFVIVIMLRTDDSLNHAGVASANRGFMITGRASLHTFGRTCEGCRIAVNRLVWGNTEWEVALYGNVYVSGLA